VLPVIVNGKQIAKDVHKSTKETVTEIKKAEWREHFTMRNSLKSYWLGWSIVLIFQKIEIPAIRDPTLAILLVGNAADSLSYVGMKMKACKKVGVHSELIHLPETTT